MRQLHALAGVAALAVVTTFAASGWADLAPPGRPPDTCTMEQQAAPGQECHPCRAYYGNHEHCPESLAAFGFTKKCRSYGASNWSEIWCRPESAASAKVPSKILEQLSDASGKPGPMPSGLPAPSAAASGAPAPSASAAPVASGAEPVAPAAAAPPPAPSAEGSSPASPASVPSAPPRKAGACSMGGQGAADSSLLVACAAALAMVTRRRSEKRPNGGA